MVLLLFFPRQNLYFFFAHVPTAMLKDLEISENIAQMETV